MRVQPVSSKDDLSELYAFVARNLELDSQHRRSLDYYLAEFASHPTLMLRAVDDNGTTIGGLLASVENDHVLIGEVVVAEAARRLGVGSALLMAVEDQTRGLGRQTVVLGARDDAEGFYLRVGYEPQLFVELDGDDSRVRLKAMTDAADVPMVWHECTDNGAKAILMTAGVDKRLQAHLDAAGGRTQYLFRKLVT